MNNRVSRHYFISGKVQGVWFRATTKEKADALGLTGWVRNLSDGRVEALVCGDKNKVDVLHEWLKHGPALARVDDFFFEEIEWQDHEAFETR